MKIKSGLLYVIIFLCISCKKTGSSNPSQSGTYNNATTGSTWNYHATDNSTLNSSTDYTITSTSKDSSINGRSYHVFINSAGGNQYLNVSGHDYYEFDSLPAGLGAGVIERLYLKDDAALTTNWSQNLTVGVPGSPIPIDFTISNIIAEKGVARTVNGTSYADVIHVSTTISSPLIPSASLVTDINSYYAPKYGLIENSNIIHLNFVGMVQDLDTETKLVSASLK